MKASSMQILQLSIVSILSSDAECSPKWNKLADAGLGADLGRAEVSANTQPIIR